MRCGRLRSNEPLVRTIRLLALLPVLAGLTVIGSTTRVVPALVGCAQAAGVHHAALVVEHGNGSVITRCVAFPEDSITGDVLLQRSGVENATAVYFSQKAVCQIDSEPSPYPPSCLPPGGRYWALFVSRADGSWGYSSLGISSQTFRDGDAEGFRYEGQSDNTTPPLPVGVCPPPATTPPTPTPTSNPAPGGPGGSLIHPAIRPAFAATAAPATPATTAVATTAPAISHPVVPAPSGSATAFPTVAASSAPPAKPPSVNAAGVAASGLGVALLGLLVVQLARGRRRAPARPGAPPSITG